MVLAATPQTLTGRMVLALVAARVLLQTVLVALRRMLLLPSKAGPAGSTRYTEMDSFYRYSEAQAAPVEGRQQLPGLEEAPVVVQF